LAKVNLFNGWLGAFGASLGASPFDASNLNSLNAGISALSSTTIATTFYYFIII